jgi:hypothetical protein
LIDAGVDIADEEAELDVSKIGHIRFPDIPDMTRRSYRVRRDLVVDVAVHDRAATVAALRIVRARHPIDP